MCLSFAMNGAPNHRLYRPGSQLQMAWFLLLLSLLGPISTVAQNAYQDGLQQSIAEGSVPRLYNIFGNPKCFEEEERGICYGEIECLMLAGRMLSSRFTSSCPLTKGLCCQFRRTCDQRTSQEASTFQSRNYPKLGVANAACPFLVIKRSSEMCGVRVEVEDLELPGSFGNCARAYYRVSGIKGNTIRPQCGYLTGKTFQYDISKVDQIILHISALSHLELKFKLHVTQILCKDFTGEILNEPGSGSGGGGGASGGGSGSGSGGGGGGGGSITTSTTKVPMPPAPPITTTTTTTTTTVAPPPVSYRCGRKGPSLRSRRDLYFLGLPTYFTDESLEEHGYSIPVQHQAETQGVYPLVHPPPVVAWQGFGVSHGVNPHVVQGSSDEVPPSTQTGVVGPPEGRGRKSSKKGRNGSERYEELLAVSRNDPPILTTLEYDGPPNKDSFFQYYAGPNSLLSSRITFGLEAGKAEFPWQVAITVSGKFHCGGSIISPTHILTAAHCAVRYEHNPGLIDLTLGATDLTINEAGLVKVKPRKIVVHPRYSRKTLQNDIALMTLPEPIRFTQKIQPLCLPSSNIATDSKSCLISGWGRNEQGKLQTTLHKLWASVETNARCDERWQNNGAPAGFIADTMMCMDASNGDSCNGDSGGPSCLQLPNGDFVLVGIVSFGSGSCTDADLPGVYTRVGAFLDWIRENQNN